jgi:hypothetical protein
LQPANALASDWRRDIIFRIERDEQAKVAGAVTDPLES